MIPKKIQKYILLAIGIAGLWLIYWDITDNIVTYLHSIGITPFVVGIIIVIIVGFFGIKVFK